MKTDALKKLERYAVVGGPDWMRSCVSVAGALAPFPVRHFQTEDAARAWLAASATENRGALEHLFCLTSQSWTPRREDHDAVTKKRG